MSFAIVPKHLLEHKKGTILPHLGTNDSAVPP